MEKMDAINDRDPHAIHDMFRMHFQLENADKVPADAKKDFVVFASMVEDRGEIVGGRWRVFFKECVAADGTVDWGKVPLYDLAWTEEGFLDQCKHISGAIGRPPPHLKIPRSWVLHDPCSDGLARFEPNKTRRTI